MKDTLHWEVEQARGRLRGKGWKATRRVTVKASLPPTIFTLNVAGTICQIKELFGKEKEQESKSDDKRLLSELQRRRRCQEGTCKRDRRRSNKGLGNRSRNGCRDTSDQNKAGTAAASNREQT